MFGIYHRMRFRMIHFLTPPKMIVKTVKSLSQVRSNLTGSPVVSGYQLGASELFSQVTRSILVGLEK